MERESGIRAAESCEADTGCSMTCYHPIEAWRSKELNASGKRGIVFDRSKGLVDRPLVVPCGQCIGCRLERSRQWAVRCVHEAQLHEHNSYITLTYNDKHLPSGNTLVKKHFQDFMKRLRKGNGHRIRYFHCGEYGDRSDRPHYHALLFGHDFSDKVPWKKNDRGELLYTSEDLEEKWGKGFCSIGAVTFDSAAYVARYIMKKVTGDGAEEHYEHICKTTGEITQRQPEYVTMSRRPGIAAEWFEAFADDVYPSDFITVRGVKMRPPKYYDRQLERDGLSKFKKARNGRIVRAKGHADNNTPARLKVREEVKKSQIKQLGRKL